MKTLIALTLVCVVMSIPAVSPCASSWQDKPVRLQLLTDKECYEFGEEVNIELQAVNATNADVTLQFASGYQADYCIDDEYLWSRGKAFTMALTNVEIPAGETHSWRFTHTPHDLLLSPGPHVISATVVGYGRPDPLTITVGRRNDLEVTVSTDRESYPGDEEIPIHVTITNNSDSEFVLHFRSARQAGYSIDGRYVRFYRSDTADLGNTITLSANGGQHTWDFLHDPTDYPLTVGTHTIRGIVEGYGHSDAITINISSGLEIGVHTDEEEYDPDQDVHIFVTATNTLPRAITLTFRTSQQASYSIDGIYRRSRYGVSLPVASEVVLNEGESKEWEFVHTPDDYRLLPGTHSIVGEVIGYGESQPTDVRVVQEEPVVDVSVTTDKASYAFGEPVTIEIVATNVSGGAVTLHFPTLQQADYQMDEDYLWSRGKRFLPIATSVTIPDGGEMSWRLVHFPREYRLAPGDHSVVGIVVGYGMSDPVTFSVEESQQQEVTVEGLLVELPTWEEGKGGMPRFLLYSHEGEEVYYLIPADGVDLAPYVNMTVRVSGNIPYILVPVPWIPLVVTGVEAVLKVEVETDKIQYHQWEDIQISVFAHNMTADLYTLHLESIAQVIARLDNIIVPGPSSDVDTSGPITVEIPGGERHEWKFILRGDRRPLSMGEHFVSGEILGYGKSDRIRIEIIERPSQRIVVQGIVDRLADGSLQDSSLTPRYVLVDRDTGENLYLLRNPAIDFDEYLGQFVEVVGLRFEEINNQGVSVDQETGIPQLFVLRIRRLLAIAVSTDKIAYSPDDTIHIYVTAKNCTAEQMTLTFEPGRQAFYRMCAGDVCDSDSAESDDLSETITIEPHGLHVWEFEHNGETFPADEGSDAATYTVVGGLYGYGESEPVTISIENNPPGIVTPEGVIERFWWWRWFWPIVADYPPPDLGRIDGEASCCWPWFCRCRYILFDPVQGEVTYFLVSDRVELGWYVGKHVRVTGYPSDVLDVRILLPEGEDSGWPPDIEPPFPPILPPSGPPQKLDVVSVVPIDEQGSSDQDGNGLRDSWEVTTGLREIGAGEDDDSDGDGMSNLQEYLCGTDPLDTASVARIDLGHNVAGMVTLRWKTVAGKTYSIYCADGLSGGTVHWRRLVGGIEGTGDEFLWTDEGTSDIAPSNGANVNRRFYRVEIE